MLKWLLIFIFIFPVSESFSSCRKDTINVLTLNSWMIPVLRKKTRERTYIISEKIKNFDLVTLQEMFSRRFRKLLVGLTNEQFDNRYQTTPFYFLNSGLFTFSKFEILETDFLAFTNCHGVQCMSLKGVLYLKVKSPQGFEIDLFSTHLQAFQQDEWVRDYQLLEVRDFIDSKSSKNRLAIFTGDFNIIAEVPEYKKLISTLYDFVDVWTLSNPSAPGYTWDPYVNPFSEADFKEDYIQQRIDYIFVRNAQSSTLKIAQTKIELGQKEVSKLTGEEMFGSDHFGLSSKLEISENCD